MKKKIIISVVVVLSVLMFAYLNDYYRYDPSFDDQCTSNFKLNQEIIDDHYIYSTNESDIGIIFYPGGKVEKEAYIPLMKHLANHNIHCVLVDMPFHLAIFDINAADMILKQFPNIDKWYMAGHSLGGSMASKYIVDHQDEFSGLILLAAYSCDDLSDSSLDVLSIYGSEDQVLNRDKYQKYYSNLPSDTIEHVINGGNHAYFGNYGNQDKDGIATISVHQQIIETVDVIVDFVK